MKTSLLFIIVSMFFAGSTYAKVILKDGLFYVESKGNRSPIALLNNLASAKSISEVKLFGKGNINIVSFAKEGEKEKLYSVAEDGYIYSIKPFSDYKVSEVTPQGVRFKERPNRTYKINSKGFFLY
jgi:hypothetical protein